MNLTFTFTFMNARLMLLRVGPALVSSMKVKIGSGAEGAAMSKALAVTIQLVHYKATWQQTT